MQNNRFEQAFGDFLDRREYDQAESALFDIVRIAFLAGWRAAGGAAPQPQKMFQIIGQKDIASNELENSLCPRPEEGKA